MWDQIIKADKEMGLPEIPYPTENPTEIRTRDSGPIAIDLDSDLIAEWLRRGKGSRSRAIALSGFENLYKGTDSDFNPRYVEHTPGVYWLYEIYGDSPWGCMWYWFGGDWAIEIYGDGYDFNFEVISMKPDEEDSDGNSIFTRHDQKGNWIKVFDIGYIRHKPLSHLLNWVMTKDFDKLLL